MYWQSLSPGPVALRLRKLRLLLRKLRLLLLRLRKLRHPLLHPPRRAVPLPRWCQAPENA
jgi:hypothetical protein